MTRKNTPQRERELLQCWMIPQRARKICNLGSALQKGGLTSARCPRSHAIIALRSSMTETKSRNGAPVSCRSITLAAAAATRNSFSRDFLRGIIKSWSSVSLLRHAASTCSIKLPRIEITLFRVSRGVFLERHTFLVV